MSRSPEVQQLVDALVGTWLGRGEGGYPTIEPFRYREVLEITERSDHPALHYEQRTWRVTGEGDVVSHWETGLLRISSDGTVRLLNAQAGRTEAMSGNWERRGDGFVLRLASSEYAGDHRVRASTRLLTVRPGSLGYSMSMETTATGEMSLHLEASLTRPG